MAKRTIGILTGGGDCPGLNAVIRGVAKAAQNLHGIDVIGFRDGFEGLVEKRFVELTSEKVSGLLTQGGTILGTSNRSSPFAYTVGEGEHARQEDRSKQCMELYEDLGLEALICIGGDGTMTIGGNLTKLGANVVGVPKTIDKDLMETDSTFGFDSARATATEAVDKLHSTAHAHHRIMVVEVMGRNAGWLALESGIAGGGDVILIPEIPYSLDSVATSIRKRSRFGKKFSIVVVAEGAAPVGGDQVVEREIEGSPERVRLGGIGQVVARDLENLTGIASRVTVLGHLQRGGTPTPLDRLLATRFAVKAVELVAEKRFNEMVALKGDQISSVPIEKIMNQQRKIPIDSEMIEVARAIGTCFGEA